MTECQKRGIPITGGRNPNTTLKKEMIERLTEKDASDPPAKNRRFSSRPSVAGEKSRPIAKPSKNCLPPWSTLGKNSNEVIEALQQQKEVAQAEKNSKVNSHLKMIFFEGASFFILLLILMNVDLGNLGIGMLIFLILMLPVCFSVFLVHSIVLCELKWMVRSKKLNRIFDPNNVHAWVVDEELWNSCIEMNWGENPNRPNKIDNCYADSSALFSNIAFRGTSACNKRIKQAYDKNQYDKLACKPVCSL